MRRFGAALSTVLLAALAQSALAQTARPRIASLAPAGLQRGLEGQANFTGTWIGTAVAVLAQHPGIVFDNLKPSGAAPDARNPEGNLAARLRVAPDVPPGRYAVRVLTIAGVSDPAYLVVGQWTEVLEVEPNTGSAPQKVASPSTVVGVIGSAEDTDTFRIAARKGETLVVDIAAGSIGSPLVPIAVLRNSAGFEVASGMALRSPDALIRYPVPTDGDYTLSIRDLSFRGGGEYVYRATVGAIPWIGSIHPPGGSPGGNQAVRLRGANLGESVRTVLTLPAGSGEPTIAVRVPFGAFLSNPVSVGISDLPGMMEAEPNSALERAQPISPPVVVSAVLDPAPGRATDEDWFSFQAKAGETFVFAVQSVQLGGRIEPILSIHDEKGGSLATSGVSDGVRDPTMTWSAPADGRYRIKVADLHKGGGPDETYRLRVSAPMPDVRLDAFPDAPIVGPGGRVPVTVSVERLEGYTGPVVLEWPDPPPGVRALGAMTVPANATQTVIVLEADQNATPAGRSAWVRVAGRVDRGARAYSETYAKNNDQLVRSAVRQPMPVVSVGGRPDIVVDTESVELTVAPGGSQELPVRIARAPGFTAKVPLVLFGGPAGVTAVGEIAAGASEVRLAVKVDGNSPQGDFTVAVVGRSMLDELRWMEHASRPIVLHIRR
ncbi:MAG: hypothetical protein ACKO5K_17140 [Armatimonadota bacterium]